VPRHFRCVDAGLVDASVRAWLTRPSLTASEERVLARRARSGDEDARSALIAAGMRSVVLRARMRGLRDEELRDAVQAGAVGLIRAVDRFDPDRGVRLATYAWHFIGAEMTTEVRREVALGDHDAATEVPCDPDTDLLEGLPSDQIEVLQLRFGIGSQLAVPMTRRAVAERLGVSPTTVRTIEGKAMRQLRRRLAKVVDRAPRQREADPP
jgi:DNA-directed RNA polymerase sigma subunit (sigma70/sigma32)